MDAPWCVHISFLYLIIYADPSIDDAPRCVPTACPTPSGMASVRLLIFPCRYFHFSIIMLIFVFRTRPQRRDDTYPQYTQSLP